MSLFKGGAESPQAHAGDFADVANIVLNGAYADITDGNELLDEGAAWYAIEILNRAVSAIGAMRTVLTSAGISGPKVFSLLDELETEARTLRRTARERLADGADEDE